MCSMVATNAHDEALNGMKPKPKNILSNSICLAHIGNRQKGSRPCMAEYINHVSMCVMDTYTFISTQRTLPAGETGGPSLLPYLD